MRSSREPKTPTIQPMKCRSNRIMGQDLIATPGCTLFGSRLFYECRRF
jgi:hypothetical protein